MDLILQLLSGTRSSSFLAFRIVKVQILLVAMTLAVVSCGKKEHIDQDYLSPTGDSAAIRYARGFRIHAEEGFKVVEVLYPFQGATSGYKYLLVPKDKEIPPHDSDTRVIRIPLESIVCTSTTHIPLLDYLGETDKLVGFPTTDYISSEKMRKRINNGKVMELGVDKGLNLERLAVLQPDAVMGYTMTGDYGQFRKIETLGIPVVINGEYLEQHPLGRAEWIKFMALFFGREAEADSVFRFIEKNYLDAMAAVSSVDKKPTVMSGIMYGDAWFVPAGENYASRLLQDARCQYLWQDTPGVGFLQLPFESIYAKAHDADIWIGTGSYKTLAELSAADHRYSRFRPFIEQRIYNYDAREGEKGGNEFLELGYLRPDLILRDIISICHPEALPEHTLFFHRRLK